MPLNRKLYHQIPLISRAKPTSIKPYRSSFIHKKEIERLVREMLSNPIIQHSSSHFASPALLVKKKDNTRRFCINYKQLNNLTIKSKVPITLTDELNRLNSSQSWTYGQDINKYK